MSLLQRDYGAAALKDALRAPVAGQAAIAAAIH